MNSYRIGKQVRILALAALFLTPFWTWGQTDYSGTYYIGVYGKNNSSQYTPDNPNNTNNFYLCPTEDWLYYVATNNCQHTPDNGQPFITSYKCKDHNDYDLTKAVWVITKQSNSNYYYIQQGSSGKYLVFNGQIGNGGANRIRVHLETIEAPTQPDDNALFAITLAISGDYSGYWLFHPKNASSGYYLNITDGNYDSLLGTNGKTDGPTVTGYGASKNVGGTIGQWSEANNTSSFYLEPVVLPPTIAFSNETNEVTITASNGVIYYTTDGSTPTSSLESHTSPVTFTPTSFCTIKAIAVKSWDNSNYEVSSAITTLELQQVATPVIENVNNAISITTDTEGAIIYYTTDGNAPTTSSYVYTGPLTENVSGVPIRAIAVKENMINSDIAGPTMITLQCEAPVVQRESNGFRLICAIPNSGVTIYYTVDGSQPSTASASVSSGGFVSHAFPVTVRAFATASNYTQSTEIQVTLLEDLSGSGTAEAPYLIEEQDHVAVFLWKAGTEEGASAWFKVTSTTPLDFSGAAPITRAFSGHFDGNLCTLTGFTHALFSTVDGGTVCNVILKDVNISGSGNVGAIVNTAKGSTKVYNCGILSGSVSGGTNTGGLVGLIEAGSSVRVVNCYNFANVSGSGYAAGIVGKNEGTVADDKTVGNVRIALCMMYGNVTGAANISPVYGGNHVNNVKNFTEYNYWRYRSGLQYTAYNDQMAIDKDDFLTRFPFYIHILNTHREMAAFFLFGGVNCNNVDDISADDIAEIGHWVLKKDVADYPIIEPWPNNTRKVLDAPTPSNILTEMGTNGYLNVTVKIGSNTYNNQNLPITDMDEDNYDYTWGKVVLPFANEFEVNTDYGKICTGWKITNITGGTQGTFENYNVSNRNCTTKDLFETTGFIFAQGGNYIVPYGVTAITIEANFANAFYLCDESYDIAYEKDKTGNSASGYVTRTTLAGTTPSTYHGKTVYKTLTAVLGAMSDQGTTHAQAVVLVGNYHQDDESLANLTSKGYTIMSIDADNNQEPDYAVYSNNTQDRPAIPPTRFDFVAFIPLGMSSHVTNTKFFPNTPIWKPRGWFEITETGFMFANQFEIESDNFNTSGSDLRNYRCIINGGYFTQMVRSRQHPCTKLQYYQIGGKAYVKEFYPGNHSANNHANTFVPVNVTGGEIEQCFMTGYGKGTVYGPYIYFWCAGGKIHKFLASYMEKPRETSSIDGHVNMTAKIDHAIIGRFFGGGTTEKARITGNIDVTIDNSRVDFYCGGPEFGNMSAGKTVTTHATNTTFGEYYGAGFGGTATTYTNDEDGNIALQATLNYPAGYFTDHYLDSDGDADVEGRLRYKANYGLGNCYKFEFIMHSRGHNGVARFYTGYASFSLATTGSVENVLDSCTILKSFFGAGCQGKVAGTVTSTLTDCTVLGSAYGGGYKAAANEVPVYPTTAPSLSVFKAETGIFSDFGTVEPEIYTWQQGKADPYPHDTAYQDQKYLYTGTDVILSDLGNVTDNIKITLDGKTTVMGSVFGGGYESKSLSNTEVQIYDRTKVFGNIYGGGNMGKVSGDTKVIINGTVPDETPTGNANNNNPNH